LQILKKIYCFFILLFFICPYPCLAETILPQRIISLAPSITREVYDLGSEALLVGVTYYHPNCARSKEIVGTLTELNIEKIVMLRPDLVLASKGCNKEKDVYKLKSLGIHVSVLDEGADLEGICESFIELGVLLGKGQKAKELVDNVVKQVSLIQNSIKSRVSKRIFWQVSSSPIITINNNTFASEFIRLAGCTNIFGDMPNRYPRVNIEDVISKNPDVIIIVADMEGTSSSLVSLWRGFAHIDAVKEAKVFIIQPDKVCQPTPLMFLEGYKTMINLLYPGVI